MGKINSINSLELEMEKMRLRMRSIENKLDDNLNGLQDNYGMMALNSVLGKEKKAKIHSFWAKMADKLLENPKLHNNIGKWVDRLADKLAAGIAPEEEASTNDEKPVH